MELECRVDPNHIMKILISSVYEEYIGFVILGLNMHSLNF